MRKIQLLEGMRLTREPVPVAGDAGADARAFLEYLLHRIAKYPQPCSMRLQSHDDGVLFAARILMFVADDDTMTLRQRGDNHRISLQECRDAQRQLRISVLMLSNPRGNVGRKP